MTKEEIQQVLDLHAAWLCNREGGKRANLSRADLSRADLYGANLYGANLSRADLSRANLHGANLSRANLYGADLSRADLSRANLYGANLHGAKNAALVWAQTEILPREGQIIGWKKCSNNVIVKLLVGKTARRSNSTGRKCRAERVKVLEVIGAEVGISQFNKSVEYRAGKIVECDKWNEDRWVECGGGIHFFLTREEAEAWEL